MTQAVQDRPQVHMGLPLPHSKLAIWFFLVTESAFVHRPTWPTPSRGWMNRLASPLGKWRPVCAKAGIGLQFLASTIKSANSSPD